MSTAHPNRQRIPREACRQASRAVSRAGGTAQVRSLFAAWRNDARMLYDCIAHVYYRPMARRFALVTDRSDRLFASIPHAMMVCKIHSRTRKSYNMEAVAWRLTGHADKACSAARNATAYSLVKRTRPPCSLFSKASSPVMVCTTLAQLRLIALNQHYIHMPRGLQGPSAAQVCARAVCGSHTPA